MAGSVSLLSRGVARSVDLVLALAMAEAFPMSGWLGGMLYLLVADGVRGGRSLGKGLMGLRVIGREGADCSLEESMLRNLDFALALLLWKLPIVGWPVFIGVFAIESVIIIGSSDALRMGDELARTRVVPADWAAPEADAPVSDAPAADAPGGDAAADTETNAIHKEESAP